MARQVGWLLILTLFTPLWSWADLPRGDAGQAGFSREKLERIDAMLRDHVDRKLIAGGSALVAKEGKIIHLPTIGMADIEAERKMDEKTIFRVASMTKPITSVGVMILHDEGKLKLDDPVSKFIPEFANSVVLVMGEGQVSTEKAGRQITVHDLLTHTSGITYRFINRPHLGALYADSNIHDGLSEMPGTIGDNVRRLAKLPLFHQPGAGWEYGLNTDVLGRVIEVASGQTLDEFFRERIFKPLGMNDSHFVLPKEKRDRLAAVYAPGENQTIQRLGDKPVKAGQLIYSATYPLEESSTYYSGGAGVVSTIHDYAQFLQMLLNRGELNGARILKPETVDLMTANQIGELRIPFGGHGDGFGYGFGVVTERGKEQDRASVGSYSWGGFFYTYFWVDPQEKVIAILMTQIYPNGHLKLREGLKTAVYDAIEK